MTHELYIYLKGQKKTFIIIINFNVLIPLQLTLLTNELDNILSVADMNVFCARLTAKTRIIFVFLAGL